MQVAIEKAAGSHNLYSYDQRRAALRLSGVAIEGPSCPFERGHIVNTVAEGGAPLAALLLVSVPTFPGCLVETRILGGVELTAGGERLLLMLGIPAVETSRSGVVGLAGLPPGLRARIVQALPGFRRWLTREEAAPVIREATEAYWQAKAKAESGARHGAAWKVSAPPRGVGERGEAEPHTWAEYLIPSLPLRFQRYVEELLLPDERILFFVERPEFVAPGALAALRRQKLRRGLLVVTDRQVMTMLDSLPPGATMVAWGYAAKATAVERLDSVWLERRNSAVEFGLAIGSATGVERYSILFPQEQEEALREAVALLERFLGAGATSVRRLYAYGDAAAGRGDEGREQLAAMYPHLAQGVARAGGRVLAAAAARGPEGRGLGPALVVADQRVLVFPGSRSVGGPVEWQEYAVADISSVETLRSLLGCRSDLFLPDEEEVDKVTLKYDYPDSPAFVPAFVTLRHLLGRPLPG